jgi:hypothetical protein
MHMHFFASQTAIISLNSIYQSLFVIGKQYCNYLGVLNVIYKTGSGLDDWIYWHFIHTLRDCRQHRAITDLHTFQFTVTHVLGSSVFTCRILATDLINSLTVTLNHTWSFLHRLIPILPLFCNCQFRRLDSVQFLCSKAHILVGWRLETRLDYGFSKSKSKSHCDWRSVSQ